MIARIEGKCDGTLKELRVKNMNEPSLCKSHDIYCLNLCNGVSDRVYHVN